jgi:hypothetical protein
MEFSDDEVMKDDVLADLGLYGEISEADFEEKRQRILRDQISPEILNELSCQQTTKIFLAELSPCKASSM